MAEFWVLALAYPLYLLAMSVVLRLIGVPKDEVVKWALKQAGRQRLTDLIKVARGIPPTPIEPPDEPP